MSIPRYYLSILKNIEEEKMPVPEDSCESVGNGIKDNIELKPLAFRLRQKAEFAESEMIESLTGLNTSFIGFYKTQSVEEVKRLLETMRKNRIQNDKNIAGKISLRRSKL